MLREVKISNTRLKIVVHRLREGNDFFLESKNRMLYQFIITSDYNFQKIRYFYTSRVDSIKLLGNIGFTIEKCDSLNRRKRYTDEERKIILINIIGTPLNYLSLIEEMCISLEDENVINSFYSSYGRRGLTNFKEGLFDLIADPLYSPKITQNLSRRRIYKSGKRYSVYSLLNDLVKDKAKILVDQDLIGKYSRISASKKQKPAEVRYDTSCWENIQRLVGNSSRANLSLQYVSTVNVQIPDNPHNIPKKAGENLKCIKSCNIIRDGMLNVPFIAVQVSKSLKRRLIGTGCIRSCVIYNNRLLLDLSKLPIISRSELEPIDPVEIAKLEVEKFIAKIAIIYYTKLENRFNDPTPSEKPMSPELIEKTKYLRSLGIVDRFYYPVNETREKENRSYSATELQVTLSNILGTDIGKVYRSIGSYISTGSVDKFLSAPKRVILTEILESIKGYNLEYWEKRQTSITNQLRRKVFHSIMSKGILKGDRVKFLEDTVTEIAILDGSENFARVSWKIKEININL